MEATGNQTEVTCTGRIMVASDAQPERNGVGAYYNDLIDQLSERGWKVGFAGPSTDDTDQWRLAMPGDRTQQVCIPSPGAVARQMRELAPSIIVSATPGPYGLLGLWWARRLGIPLIAGFHTDFPAVTRHYSSWWLRHLARYYFSKADRRLFRRASLVLGNSEPMLEVARQRGAARTALIGTLLPSPMLKTPVTPPRPELSRVLFAGRLAPEKNVHLVVEAARQMPDVRFTIAGDGPLYGLISCQAAGLPNLDCTGWVSREQLMRHMDQADLLVLPSQLESFGNVALEAMARQRLALVSAGCGIVDWPELAAHLFRLAPGEPLDSAIRRLAALPSARRHGAAKSGRDAALALNDDSLTQWENLLGEEMA